MKQASIWATTHTPVDANANTRGGGATPQRRATPLPPPFFFFGAPRPPPTRQSRSSSSSSSSSQNTQPLWVGRPAGEASDGHSRQKKMERPKGVCQKLGQGGTVNGPPVWHRLNRLTLPAAAAIFAPFWRPKPELRISLTSIMLVGSMGIFAISVGSRCGLFEDAKNYYLRVETFETTSYRLITV